MKVNRIPSFNYTTSFKANTLVDSGVGEYSEILTNNKGDRYTQISIYDKPYRFRVEENFANKSEIDEMVENIKKTKTGRFVRNDIYEYFIPHILSKAPNIDNNELALENGSPVTEINEEVLETQKILQEKTKQKVDLKDLKVTKYLKRKSDGFSNNVVRMAYSYYDKLNNDFYVYIPAKRKLQILESSCFVKKIRV